MTLKTDGQPQPVPVTEETFADHLFMAVKLPVGHPREVTARWEEGKVLKVTERCPGASWRRSSPSARLGVGTPPRRMRRR